MERFSTPTLPRLPPNVRENLFKQPRLPIFDWRCWGFFLFCRCSRKRHTVRFLACPPGGGSLQALLSPPPRPVPKVDRTCQRNNKGDSKKERQRERLMKGAPKLLLVRRGHEGRRFLFVYSLLACDLSDHGENMYSPFPVCCPRSGGPLQAPLCPPPRPIPRRFFCLIITRVRPIEIMARVCTVQFLSAVRAVTARC